MLAQNQGHHMQSPSIAYVEERGVAKKAAVDDLPGTSGKILRGVGVERRWSFPSAKIPSPTELN